VLKSRKALNPVAASIILIAVVVAVTITVGAWMGALTFSFVQDTKNIVVVDSFSNYTQVLNKLNVTIVTAPDFLTSQNPYIECHDLDDFLIQVKEHNVSYVLSDHKPVQIPYVPKNTGMMFAPFWTWFYVELPHVGKTAIVVAGSAFAHQKA